MMTLWRYTKAQANRSWLLPPAILALMLAWLFANHAPRWGGVHQLPDLYPTFEYFLPLAAAIYLAGLPAFDRDEGTAETLLTCPRWPSLHLLMAGAGRSALWLATFILTAFVARVWYYPVSPLHLAAITAAPALGLSGMALVAGAVTRSQVGGLIAPSLWWLLDLSLPGKLNEQFYLFRVTEPLHLAGVTAAEQTRNVALLGAACWLLALALAHWRAWWVK